MIKTYPIENSPLYKLSNRKKILELLKLENYSQLERYKDNKNYNKFSKEGKNGKIREIENPNPELKKFLKDFNKLLQRIELPDYVKAGKKGCSYVQNGQSHNNGIFFNCTDISSFYPNTKKERLFQCLLYEFKMSPDIAGLFAEILTCDGHLPTGSPTSQLLAYWSYKKTFDRIYKYSKSLGINMTLFVDDMTFSSKRKIPNDFLLFINEQLTNVGLNIKKEKTKKYNSKGYKIVTGTCITPDNKVKIPNRIGFEIIKLKGKGLENLDNAEIKRLKGLINSAKQIQPKFFSNYYKTLCSIAMKD